MSFALLKKESCLTSIPMMKNLTYKNLSANIYEKKPNASNYANFYIYRCGSSIEVRLPLKANENTNPFWKAYIQNTNMKLFAFVISEILGL